MFRISAVLALVFTALLANNVSGEPLLLRGIIENGSLLLQKADSQFLHRLEEIMSSSADSSASIRGSIGPFLETYLSADGAGPSTATVVFDPVITEQVLMAPIMLKDTILKQLQENSESVLEVLLPENVAEEVESSNWPQVASLLSGLRFDKIRERVSEELGNVTPILAAVAPEGTFLQGISSVVSGDIIFGTLKRLGIDL